MMKNIKELVFSKTMAMLLAVSVVISVIYGLIRKPFYLQFLNGLALIGFFLLLAGIMRENWKDGGFLLFSWKPDKGSYREFRKQIMEERKDTKNHILLAGIILIIADVLLSLLY